jgi:hypothetical protein
MRIPVYILPTNYPTTSNHLYNLFQQNPMFYVVNPSCYSCGVGPVDDEGEASQVIDALENAYVYYPDNYVLIIKDTSVTNSNAFEIGDLIDLAINLNYNCYKKDNWELCYMCRWLDRCDLYKEVAKVDGVTKIVRTYSPLGIQAILFSPKGRDVLLGRRKMKNKEYFTPIEPSLGDQINREISLGNISAVCTIPNVFDYNVILAKTELDLFKLSDCRLPGTETEEEDIPSAGVVPFFWFLSITVGVILIAWFFYQFIAKDIGYKDFDEDADDIKRVRRAGG